MDIKFSWIDECELINDEIAKKILDQAIKLKYAYPEPETETLISLVCPKCQCKFHFLLSALKRVNLIKFNYEEGPYALSSSNGKVHECYNCKFEFLISRQP